MEDDWEVHNAHVRGSRHLFGCSCALCECVCRTLRSILKERPDLRGSGVVFDPLVSKPVVQSDHEESLLLCTARADVRGTSDDPVRVLRNKCTPAAARALGDWVTDPRKKVRCRPSVLGGVLLEVPDATGSYCRGATVRQGHMNDRFFQVIDTVSTYVRVEQLLPGGEQRFVFDGLARGYIDDSTAATPKTLLGKVEASAARVCFSCEEGDVLWADSGSLVCQGPTPLMTLLSLQGFPKELELAVPVLPNVLRPFMPRTDDQTLQGALKILGSVARTARLGTWNIVLGDVVEAGAPWKLAIRNASPQSGS
jgi:hypothetical protein